MQPWQPGARLLSDFDIKIGRLSASVRKATLSDDDITRACRVTDDAIAQLLKPRKDHVQQIDPGEWNKRLPRPRSHETVRRWIRAGKIYPAPVLDGREYLLTNRPCGSIRRAVQQASYCRESPMARTRNHARRDLPPNLYVRNGGYYCYRDPRTGKEYGLGRDKRLAVTEAIAANMAFW